MIRLIFRWPLHAAGFACLLLVAGLAHAQPQEPNPPAVPALAYRSLFTAYKGYADQPVTSWREANETVNRIGGWRAYAKEAAQADASAADQGAPAPRGQDGEHEAHHGGKP